MSRHILLGALIIVAAAAAADAQSGRTSVLPGTRASAFATIQGNALSSTNGVLPSAIVRLRDARLGRIVDSQATDRAGLFAFRNIDPGTYVVELISEDRSVLAASQLLAVNGGEALSAVVKLPFRIPPVAGLLGNTLPSATAVTSAAASAGVLATQVTGVDTSPQ